MEPITEQEKTAFNYCYIMPLNERVLPKYRIEDRAGEVHKQTIETNGSKYLTNRRHYELMTQYPDVAEIILTDDPEPIPDEYEEDAEDIGEEDTGEQEGGAVEEVDEGTDDEPEDGADVPIKEDDNDDPPDEEDEEEDEDADEDEEDEEEPDNPYTKSELKAMSRPDLDDVATDLEMDYTDYSNKTKIIDAILKEQDE